MTKVSISIDLVQRTTFYVRVAVEIEGTFDTEVCCQECNKREQGTDIISVVANFRWERIHSVEIGDIVS